MTEEQKKKAEEWGDKMAQCEVAVSYNTKGVFDSDGRNHELPSEVCIELRQVIENWRRFYENQFDSLCFDKKH